MPIGDNDSAIVDMSAGGSGGAALVGEGGAAISDPVEVEVAYAPGTRCSCWLLSVPFSMSVSDIKPSQWSREPGRGLGEEGAAYRRRERVLYASITGGMM